MNSINNISPGVSLPAVKPLQVGGAQQGGSFKEFLVDSIREVNSMQQSADQAVEQLVTGGDVNPAEVLTAVQKADLAFRMMMQVRNKMVAAYNEIQNMRV